MKRALVLGAFLVAGTVVACDEEVVSPPTTGGIALRVITDSQSKAAPALTRVADRVSSDRLPDADEPGLDPTAEREADRPQPDRADAGRQSSPGRPQLEAPRATQTTGQASVDSIPSPSFDIFTHLQAARMSWSGPMSGNLDLSLAGSSFTGTVTDLTPGSYTVWVEGFVGGEVDFYGETTIQVNAGPPTSASISFLDFGPAMSTQSPTTAFNVRVSWGAVTGADSYELEWDTDGTFPAPTSTGILTATSFDFNLPQVIGTYYIRGRAFNSRLTAGPRWGDSFQLDVQTDISTSGNDAGTATPFGFGDGANGRFGDYNIFPSADEDWFSVAVCQGDLLIVEVFADRLDPRSDLDSYVELYDATGTLLLASDDDGTGTFDSRIDWEAVADESHLIKVVALFGFSVGHYELDINVQRGAANDGSMCAGGGFPTVTPIAWMSDVTGDQEIYIRSADGTSVSNLTNNPATDQRPSWSPDGSQLVFVTNRDGDNEVYVIDADGLNPTNLTNTPLASDAAPAFSADGTRVAFISDRDGDFDIYTMDPNGGNVVQLTFDPGFDTQPQWSPDGSQISFASDRDGDFDIYVMNSDGSNVVQLTFDPAFDLQADWSPDASQIVFVSDRDGDFDIYVMNNDGSTITQINNDPSGEFRPVWSPDGLKFAFITDIDGDRDLWLMNTDGSNRVQLEQNGALDNHPSWQPLGSAPPAPVALIVITPEGATLTSAGATTTLTAEARTAAGGLVAGRTFTWTSLNTNVASVDGSGTITAQGVGQATISAQTDGVTGYALATVTISGLQPVASWSPATSGTTQKLNAVWGTSANDVFAVGDAGGILHYDGASWSPMTSGIAGGIFGIWGSSASDVYAVGINGIILHYGGTSWSQMTSGTAVFVQGVWGTSPSDIFAVGFNGTILHYDGTGWSPMTSGTTTTLWAVWGTSASDVYAVGEAGTILRYDGTSWNPMTSGTAQFLNSVWGTTPSEIFAVGFGGTILRYDGISWNAMTSGTILWLHSVWGTSPSDVYAAGEGGTILRYDGTSWNPMTSGTTQWLNGVWGAPNPNAFAVGTGGVILGGTRGPPGPSPPQ